MKQEVFVIGRDLRELVAFSMPFAGPDFSVSLIETPDVVERATALAAERPAWYLLIQGDDDEPGAYERLERLAPTTSMIIREGEDPIIALAHLIATTTWETWAQDSQPVPAARMEEQDG